MALDYRLETVDTPCGGSCAILADKVDYVPTLR
jgi:hypothetical protein